VDLGPRKPLDPGVTFRTLQISYTIRPEDPEEGASVAERNTKDAPV
jgi:hypothetical protein